MKSWEGGQYRAEMGGQFVRKFQEDHTTYILPWTAYLVTYPNRMRRLIKEFETYKKAEAAQGH